MKYLSKQVLNSKAFLPLFLVMILNSSIAQELFTAPDPDVKNKMDKSGKFLAEKRVKQD